jgi:CMP-N-acetylneuraminic acid synthetase
LAKLKKIDDDLIISLFEKEGPISTSRQNLSALYKRNCAIYLTRTDLIKKGDMFGQISRPYVMPRERSVDINEPFDFDLAEFLLKKKLAGRLL